MKNNFTKIMAVTVCLMAALILVGWIRAKTPSVQVEPLSCFVQQDRLVCFDGDPAGDLHCEKLADNTHYCTSQ